MKALFEGVSFSPSLLVNLTAAKSQIIIMGLLLFIIVQVDYYENCCSPGGRPPRKYPLSDTLPMHNVGNRNDKHAVHFSSSVLLFCLSAYPNQQQLQQKQDNKRQVEGWSFT